MHWLVEASVACLYKMVNQRVYIAYECLIYDNVSIVCNTKVTQKHVVYIKQKGSGGASWAVLLNGGI